MMGTIFMDTNTTLEQQNAISMKIRIMLLIIVGDTLIVELL